MPTTPAEARAAAERILHDVEINGDDPHDDGLLMFEADIAIVATFALEAADREARLRSWAEALAAWATNALGIAVDRRVPSADMVADGEVIVAGITEALTPASGGE